MQNDNQLVPDYQADDDWHNYFEEIYQTPAQMMSKEQE